jgi:predicted DNA-binding protein
MALSVRLEPELEALLAAEAHRRGTTKSEVVKDAVERLLGRKNPAELLQRVRSGEPMGDVDASENVSEKVKAKLRAQHPG